MGSVPNIATTVIIAHFNSDAHTYTEMKRMKVPWAPWQQVGSEAGRGRCCCHSEKLWLSLFVHRRWVWKFQNKMWHYGRPIDAAVCKSVGNMWSIILPIYISSAQNSDFSVKNLIHLWSLFHKVLNRKRILTLMTDFLRIPFVPHLNYANDDATFCLFQLKSDVATNLGQNVFLIVCQCCRWWQISFSLYKYSSDPHKMK